MHSTNFGPGIACREAELEYNAHPAWVESPTAATRTNGRQTERHERIQARSSGFTWGSTPSTRIDFTARFGLDLEGVVSRSAFKVNDDIGVYLKYASKPSTGYDEYVFTFHGTHLAELENLSRRAPSVYLALVCIQDREICGLHYGDFMAMITARREAQGSTESQYTVLVTATKGKSFRVYMNAPGVRKTMLSLPLVVSRRAFPDMIFRDDARQMARTDA